MAGYADVNGDIFITPKLKRRSGVYCIVNMLNENEYIGSSVDMYLRLHQHFHNLRNNKHHNKHLQNSWNKHKGQFGFYILEFTSNQLYQEQTYIELRCPVYNKNLFVWQPYTSVGDPLVRLKISKTLKLKYSTQQLKKHNNKFVEYFDLSDIKRGEFDSIRSTATFCKVSVKVMRRLIKKGVYFNNYKFCFK